MYLALRDIRFAKGRFALMGSVVALITLLLVLLSGLTAGLGNQNTAAVRGLSAAGMDTVAFGAPPGTDARISYTESSVTAGQLAQWRAVPGIDRAEPLGITQTRILGGSSANVALFGVEEGSTLAPQPVSDGEVLLDADTATDLGVEPGSEVRLGGQLLRVAALVDPTYYSHAPVVWTSLSSWQDTAHVTETVAAEAPVATVIVAAGSDNAAAEADSSAGTLSSDVRGSFSGLGGYSSENGSLVMMQVFLYGISALVVVAFLVVWTVQRIRDIAVLKALGGSNAYLRRDAVAQAAIIVGCGATAGGLLGALAGVAASGAAPFLLTAANTLVPVLGIVALGLAGSAVAVRRVASVDPLTALGGN